MENSVSKHRCLELCEKKPEGIIKLHETQLLIRLMKNGSSKDISPPPEITRGWDKDRELSGITIMDIQDTRRRLVGVLKNIPGMNNKDVRFSLLFGFKESEKNLLNKRPKDMQADLEKIVELANKLEKTHIVIKNAKTRDQNEKNKEELWKIEQELEKFTKSRYEKDREPPEDQA